MSLTSFYSEIKRFYTTYTLYISAILGGLALSVLLGYVIFAERSIDTEEVVKLLPFPDIIEMPSPNWSERRPNREISTIVLYVHESRNPELVFDRIRRSRNKFSVHYTISTSGALFRHVPEEKVAWHSIVGRLPDQDIGVNMASIAIGIMRSPARGVLFSAKQINTLRAVLQQLVRRYPVKYIVTRGQVERIPLTNLYDYNFPFTKLAEFKQFFVSDQ